MNKEQTYRKLTIILFSQLFLSAIMVLLFELNEQLCGEWVGNDGLNYMAKTLMVAVTLTAIPLSLSLSKFRKLPAAISDEPSVADAQMKWGVIRELLLTDTMALNLLCYYFFLDASFVYLALIEVTAIPFIYPQKQQAA